MGKVDWESPTANMYGCEPCPKCGSEFRASYRTSRLAKVLKHPVIECNCGFVEKAEYVSDELVDAC